MSRGSYRAHGRTLPEGPSPSATTVELTFQRGQVEHWIRFGRKSYEQIVDRRRSVVGFTPDSVFAFVRWAKGEHGTVFSRIDIVRAVRRGEPFQTLPFVRPGGEILLRLDSWPKVRARACRHRRRGIARPRSGRRLHRNTGGMSTTV